MADMEPVEMLEVRERTVAGGSITGAGLIVTGTLCLAALAGTGAIIALAVMGRPVPGELQSLVGGLFVAVPALLARTRPDPQAGPMVTNYNGPDALRRMLPPADDDLPPGR